MKILIIHNKYTCSGGEERVVGLQKSIFEKMGNEVLTYEKRNTPDNTLFSKILLFFTGFYNFRAKREIKAVLRSTEIDFCIVHNLYHKITPSVLTALKRASVPTLAVLHNYRLLCPIATMYRDGSVCNECVCYKTGELRCIKHNCGRNKGNSVFYALRSFFVRKAGFFIKDTDRLVALTHFQKSLFEKSGFDGAHLALIPNTVEVPAVLPVVSKKGYIGFAGRLTHEKGIDIFLNMALKMPERKFKIAGQNTLSPSFAVPSNVQFCGFLKGEQLKKFYAEADFIMVPSRWYEGFPMVILESFACGTAVLVSSVGALPEIVSDNVDGLVFDIDNPDALISRLQSSDPVSMGTRGYYKVRDNYDTESYYNRYMKLFENIKENKYEK